MSIFISEDLKERCPNFVLLMKEIEAKKRDEKFSDILQQKQARHAQEKFSWQELKIVYSVICDILIQQRVDHFNRSINKHEKECWKAVESVLSSTECLCKLDPGQSLPFGLHARHFHRLIDKNKTGCVDKGKELLRSEIYKNLHATCVRLMNFYDVNEFEDNKKVQVARAAHLGRMVAHSRVELQEHNTQRVMLTQQAADIVIEYNKALLDCCDIIGKLVSKYRLTLLPKRDMITVKNLAATAEVLTGKTKKVRLELQTDTYSRDKVEALQKIRVKLREKISRSESEQIDIEHKLQMFRELGDDFAAVADAYFRCESELERQQWMLAEVQRKTEQ